MATNLLDTLTEAVTPDILQGLTRCVGESDGAVRSGVSSLLPALLGGLASKAATPSGAGSVLSMLQGSNVDTGLIGTIGNLLGSGQTGSLMQLGTSLLSGLFGSDKVGGIGSALASISSMKASSAGNLIAMVTPLAFALLKRAIGSSGVDAGGLASMLAKQADSLGGGKLDSRLTWAMGLGSPENVLAGLRAVPGVVGSAAAGLAGAVGAATATTAAAQAAKPAAAPALAPVSTPVPAPVPSPVPAPVPSPATAAPTIAPARAATTAAATAPAPAQAPASGGIGRWLPWIIGAAILAFLLPQLKTCGGDKAAAPAATKAAAPAATPAPAPAPAAAPAPAPAAAAAPAAAPVAAPAADAAAKIAWPAKVYFETGKAATGADGEATIKAVAAAVAPDASRKISLTGYTDKTGNADANEKLARDRAVGVRDALKAAGVAEDRIGMKPPVFVEATAGSDAEARRVDITLE